MQDGQVLGRDSLSSDLFQPCGKKAPVNSPRRRVPTVAFLEFIGVDTEKLFRCFIMCGRVIKPRQSHRKESAVKDKGKFEGDSAVIKLENCSL